MSLTERFAPGDRIGNYQVERELGTSGAGIVLACVHLVLPRRAVIKVIHAAVANHQPFAIQLLREACILEALSHAGIPRVYDSGLLPDRRPWFAIEYTGDETLADRLIARGQLSAGEVAILIRDLAEILEHAHRRGVTHRGLRPDRIAIVGDGLRVIDWADARTHDAAARIPNMLPPGARAYIAPEQLRGDAIDDRADVYALGVIAYHALTGAFPTGIPVSKRRPDVIRELAQLVDQMVALDRYDRPSTGEIRDALDDLAEILVDEHVAAVAMPRMRKPRWTPAYGLAPVADASSGFALARIRRD